MSAEWSKTPQVIIVDPDRSVAELVSVLLTRDKYFSPVAEATTMRDALLQIEKWTPDIVITELSLPERSGPKFIRSLRKSHMKVKVVVYSGVTYHNLLLEGLEARPHGFVHKSEPLRLLNDTLQAVATGIHFLSPYVASVHGGVSDILDMNARITPKEEEVLQLVAQGLSSKQIAAQMNISQKTVEHYRASIMQKLGLRDVASLTIHAVRCGIVEI